MSLKIIDLLENCAIYGLLHQKIQHILHIFLHKSILLTYKGEVRCILMFILSKISKKKLEIAYKHFALALTEFHMKFRDSKSK